MSLITKDMTELEEVVKEYLDEMEWDHVLAGHHKGEVYAEVDPIGFRCTVADYPTSMDWHQCNECSACFDEESDLNDKFLCEDCAEEESK